MCPKVIYSTQRQFPVKNAMDFLYCHIKIEKEESQVRMAFEERMLSEVNEMAILQWNTCSWTSSWMEMV